VRKGADGGRSRRVVREVRADSMLQPVARSTLPDVVVRQIQELIAQGVLKPGDRLPTERELCDTLSVGRSTVREALRVLITLGVLKRQRGGVYVNAEPPLIVATINAGTITTIFEARRLFEVGLAGLAAERATEADREEMGRWLPPEGVQVDVERFKELDVGFHRAIARSAHNPLVEELFNRVQEELFRSHAFYTALDSFDPAQARQFIQRTLQDHRAIYEAIAARQPREAQRAMEAHFRQVERVMVRRLRLGETAN
jgi:GntR family transcriptional repressor for pyruvate dehydrogenase complex